MHDYMHAILIDPVKRSVARIKMPYDRDHMNKRIAEAIGLDQHGLITRAFRIDLHHALFVDDEGLLIQPNPRGYFRFNGAILAGRGLVLGNDQFGNTTGTHVSVSDIYNMVEWVEFDELPDEARNPTMTIESWGPEGPNVQVIPLTPRKP